jgi:outer membrane protein TolC
MKLLAVLSLIGVLGALSTGAAGGQALSLDDAIAAAREHNSRLEAGRQLAVAAEGEARSARGVFLPELSTGVNYSIYSGDVFFARFVPPVPGQPPVEETPIGPFDSTESVLFTLTQPIYSGGGNGAKLQASRVEKAIADQEVFSLENDLDFEVTQAYMQVLLASKSLETARNSVLRTEQNLASVRRLRQEEEALEVDVLAAQAQLASDQHGLLQAENDRSFAVLALNRLLGRDQSSDLQPADILGQTSELPQEEQALAQVRSSNPEILKAGLRIDLANAGIQGARSNYRPKVSLNGLFSWLDNEMFFKGTFWGAGLNIAIPFARAVTEGGGAMAQAKARKSAAESSLEETTSLVLLLARRAFSEASEANRAVEVAEQNRRYHEEKYRVTSSAFAESLATFDDLLEDHVELAEAELTLYQAQYQARLAEAEVRRLLTSR